MKHIIARAKTPLGLLFLTIVFDVIGIGILIPIIPQLFANPLSPHYLLPATMSLHTGYLLLGLLIATYPLGQFIATPILGQLSDRYGRKKLLALCLFGSGFGYALFAFGIVIHSLPLMFFARFFDGITGGNISIAQAAIADSTTPEHRTRNFGLIGVAFGLGFILGPFLGGVLADAHSVSWFTAATPFWFAGILCVVNASFVLFMLPETNTTLRTNAIEWNRSVHNILKAFTLPRMKTLFTVSLLFFAGSAFFQTFFSVFLVDRFSFSEGQIGNMFAYIGLWIILTQGLLIPRLAKRYNEIQILRIALLIAGPAMVLYFIPHVWWGLLLVAPFVSISSGLIFAYIPGLVSRFASREIQGEVLGINASVQALGTAIPPILAGFVAAIVTPEFPLIIAAVVIVSAALVFRFVFVKGTAVA